MSVQCGAVVLRTEPYSFANYIISFCCCCGHHYYHHSSSMKLIVTMSRCSAWKCYEVCPVRESAALPCLSSLVSPQ